MSEAPKVTSNTITMTLEAYVEPFEQRKRREHDLQTARVTMKEYLRSKFDHEDWHGVQDAASDLRDIDSELDGLRY